MLLRTRHTPSALSALPQPPLSDYGSDPCRPRFRRRRGQDQTAVGQVRETRRRARPLTVLRRLAAWACYAACFLLACMFTLAWLRTIAMAKVVSEATMEDLARASEEGASFTVLLNTFKRPQQLGGALQHYARCDGVESVRVAWSEPSPPPDPAGSPHLFDFPRPVRFHPFPTTSINNRFIPPPNLLTEAVFVVDDDIAVPCDHLLAAFGTWRRHPNTLVGFFARSHAHHGDGIWEYLYFWRVLWNMEYSMVLTKAAFVHAKYLELYSGIVGENERGADGGGGDWDPTLVEAMAQTRNYVDSHRNCEDIAMQMAVTSVSGLPPVAAFAPVVDIGLFGGISTGEGSGKWWQAPHAIKRSRCLADLHEIFCAARSTATTPAAATGAHARRSMADVAPAPSTGASAPDCEVLIRTQLFALPSRAATASLRGSKHLEGLDESDLSRVSRFALAVRAPTLAEFISADMLLAPGKMWRWFTKDDVFQRGVG